MQVTANVLVLKTRSEQGYLMNNTKIIGLAGIESGENKEKTCIWLVGEEEKESP